MDMNEEEFKELMRQFIEGHMSRPRAIYCQRCEEPRSPMEFIPGRPHGICLHCLSGMGRGEATWLKDALRKQRE